VSQKAERDAKVELYINSTWTKHYTGAYVAQAIAFSENGNHATIYATGFTADEADTKLMGALRELKLIPEGPMERAWTSPQQG
jgi:hypothetical protein